METAGQKLAAVLASSPVTASLLGGAKEEVVENLKREWAQAIDAELPDPAKARDLIDDAKKLAADAAALQSAGKVNAGA
jgi:hypothetical protein